MREAAELRAESVQMGYSLVDLMRKDIGLVMEEAASMNIALPVTSLVGQFLAEVTAIALSLPLRICPAALPRASKM